MCRARRKVCSELPSKFTDLRPTGASKACSLQSCLNKNTYNPEKCEQHVRRLYRCCWTMYQETAGKGESTACPMQSVVRRWLENHGEAVK